MRRIVWNLYAWPITFILGQSGFHELTAGRPFSLLDAAISVPSLLALHLHIWDRKAFSPWFWRIYAFIFMAWELFYNFILRSIESHQLFNPLNLLMGLPLYVGLFRYAFRKWGPAEEEESGAA